MTSESSQSPHPAPRCDWSWAYWVLAWNQMLVIVALTIFATAAAGTTRETVLAKDIELPVMSQAYLIRLGPLGIIGFSGLAIVLIAAAALFRARFLGVLIASAVFLSIVLFLIFAFFWSYYPLWQSIEHPIV